MKKYLFLIFLLATAINGYAQQHKTINGTVTDAQNNEPLIGVTVKIKEITNGTNTDIDGKYNVKPAIGHTLIFSYMGYLTQEIKINENSKTINIKLVQDTKSLKEIEIVGVMGIKRSERELTTSNKLINTDNLNMGRTVNPILGLTSKVAGLRISSYDNSKVDGDIQVNLRGIRSNDHSANAPLYVVDGVPIPNFNRINPNDIESINVLKGANGAALYGSEGVNGVLIITTKKGNQGLVQIDYSNTTLFQTATGFPDRQTEFGNGLNGEYNPSQYQSWGARYDGSIKQLGGNLPHDQKWELPYSPTKNNWKNFFKTGVNVQNDLSLSVGDALSSYYFSLQDVRTSGIIPDDKSSRTGARFNASRKIGKLTSSFNGNFVSVNTKETSSEPWTTVYRLPANVPLDKNVRDWENNDYANPNYWFSSNQMNPYFNTDNQRRAIKEQTFNGSFELDYEFTPWLNALYRGGFYSKNTDTRSTVGKFTYTTKGRTNIAGSVNDASVDFQRLNSDAILNFHKAFGKFTTRLIVGSNVRADYTKAIGVGATALVVPGLENIGNSTGELTGTSSNNYMTKYRQVAFYGEFTGGYNDYLFLTVSGRQESVSVLNPNNRSFFYPGVGLSFIFTDAIEALKDSPAITSGKVFTSFNRTGNVNGIAPYSLTTAYSQTQSFPFGTIPGFSLGSVYSNYDLTPEFVNSFEIGTQISFFKNRLNLDFAYAYSLATDGIVQASLAGSTGYDAAWVNAFEVSNNIIELSLSGDIIRQNNGMKWNVGFNLYHLKNKVEKIYGETTSIQNHRQSYVIEGKPFNSFYYNDYKRDPNGNIIVDASTGLPVSTTEQVYAGTGTPPWQLGFNTDFEYKGFRIAAQFDCRMGGIMYSEATSRMIQDGTSPITTKYNREPFVIENSVVETADGYIPNTIKVAGDRNYFNNYVANVHTAYSVSSDYFKLRELQISYTLPEKLLNKQKVVKHTTLSLIGRNLFSVWAKGNVYGDPEYVYAASNSEGYLSFRQLPSNRQFGFSVNVGF